jgi:hypothetical protein
MVSRELLVYKELQVTQVLRVSQGLKDFKAHRLYLKVVFQIMHLYLLVPE